MTVKKLLSAAVLTFAFSHGQFFAETVEGVKKINPFDPALLALTDQRDGSNPAFREALDRGDYDALMLLGQIGGEACDLVHSYLLHQDPSARIAAAKGAGYCYDTSFAKEMISSERFEDADKSGLYRALGFSGGEAGREFLVRKVNEISAGAYTGQALREQKAALFGLMQSVVYDRLTPKDLPELDITQLLSLTRMEAYGYEAAYLLGRLEGLDQFLPLQDVVAAFGAAPTKPIKRAIIRLLRQYGEDASAALLMQAENDDETIRYEVIRALGRLSDAESLRFLATAASDPSATVRHLAVTALASRNVNLDQVTALIVQHLDDPSPWVQVSSLRALAERAPQRAIEEAQQWLAGEDYYLAFSAIRFLGQTDAGKDTLTSYAAAHEGTMRGRDAAIALDPSIEAVERPRKSPSVRLVQSYQDRLLVLNTSKGEVCIAPSPMAPYAAANFFLMADSGKMNGMLWHRVIPNFVAQAGQLEDRSLADWGTIREEWYDGQHIEGAVGVATAGRDTGSTQFFINTAYNLHLDGRYTVFGQVTKGMDSARALEEGDVILDARTERSDTPTCR